MKPAPFEYVRPKTVAEASVALGRRGATTAAIAGGQSLLPMLSLRVALLDLLVDISRLDDLKTVAENARQPLDRRADHPCRDRRRQGPRHFQRPDAARRRPDLLPRDPQPRHHRRQRGARRSRRRLAVLSDRARRQRPDRRPQRRARATVADFIQGPYATTLTTGDIIMGFDMPRPEAPLRWGFAKVARKSGAFAHSIAIVTCARQATVRCRSCSAPRGPRPPLLPTPWRSDCDPAKARKTLLRAAIAADLDAHVADARRLSDDDCTRRPSCAPCGTCEPNDSHHRRIERREDQRRRRAASDARRLPARPLRPDRDASRLRARRLRRLHRAWWTDKRRARAFALAVMCDGRSVLTLEGLRRRSDDGSCCAGISTNATPCNADSARRAC